MLKRIAVFIFIIMSVFAFNGIQAKTTQTTTPLDRVVAIVDDGVITQTELDRQVQLAKAQMQKANLPLPDTKSLNHQVLQQMIDKKLQLTLAERTGIRASAQETNAAISQIAKRNHKSVDELYETVKSDGWSIDNFRQEIKEEAIIQKLQTRNVASRISISQQEVDDFLQTANRSMRAMPQYHLANILIALPATPSPEQVTKARQQAENAIQQLKKGEDFKKLAAAKSSGSKAFQGGDLGWRKLPELPAAFADRVKAMKKGEVAGPIQTPNGFHVIKLLDIRQTSDVPQSTADERKEVEQLIFHRKLNEDIQTFISDLRSQAYIKILL